MTVKYAFPNVYIGIGSTNDFIKDIQQVLGLEPSGEFDFVTMAYVTVHKHKNGLGYHDPVVDQPTWDSLFRVDSAPDTLTSTDRLQSVSSPETTVVTPQPQTVTTGTTDQTTTNAPIKENETVAKTDENTTTAQEQQEQQAPPAPVAPVVEPAPVAPVAPVVEPAPVVMEQPIPVVETAPVAPGVETNPGEQNV